MRRLVPFFCVLVACRLAAIADSISPPQTNDQAQATSEEHEDLGPQGAPAHSSEEFRVQIRTNAPTAAVSTNATPVESKSFHWEYSWLGWNGLNLEISQRTALESPREMFGLEPQTNWPTVHLEQLKMTATFGGLVEVDAAAYHTTGNLDISDDIALRRLRLRAQGDCILIFPVSYKIEIGYIPHKFNLHEAWIASDHINYIGYVVAGVFQPPMGLDLETSSRDITFMEPATVLQALAPANEAGIKIGQPVFDKRATWALGIFGGGLFATEYGNDSDNYGNVIGRFTYLAIDDIAPRDFPEHNRYLHLGLSLNLQYSSTSTVRYRSRPESYLAPHVIDTGNIDANGSGEIGAEAAYVNGPLCLQGEFIDSGVRQNNGDNLNVFGFYADASWYLTGESRPYDRFSGEFRRLVPRRDFDFGRGGAWGAFQVGARFSYTDLDSGDIQGGKIGLLMGELNWYLHSHVRWMFNAGGGHVSGAHDGNLVLFQTRIGIDL